MEQHHHFHDGEPDHPSEAHFHIKDSEDFDHQVWCCELLAGEAMSMSGMTGMTVMLSGHEYVNDEASVEHEKWVFIIDDPVDMLRFWFSLGENALKKDTWAKIVAVLDE